MTSESIQIDHFKKHPKNDIMKDFFLENFIV